LAILTLRHYRLGFSRISNKNPSAGPGFLKKTASKLLHIFAKHFKKKEDSKFSIPHYGSCHNEQTIMHSLSED
jgi:hypothetical protein